MTPSFRKQVARAVEAIQSLRDLGERRRSSLTEMARLEGKIEGLRHALAVAEQDARTIIPTEYTRPDGLVTTRRNRNGTWAIICISGHAWFWNRDQRRWDTCTMEGFNHLSEPYTYTKDEALDLLPTLLHVSNDL